MRQRVLAGKASSLQLPGVAGNYAQAPDSAALSITGDIDLRIYAAFTAWPPAATTGLISKYGNGGSGQLAYTWRAEATSGLLTFRWSVDGNSDLALTSDAAPTVSAGVPIWLKVTFDADNGAAGRTAKFYSSSDGSSYSQVGTDRTTATATSIADTPAIVQVGQRDTGSNWPMSGQVLAAEIRNGIDGTAVASPTFSGLRRHTRQFLDAQGNTWSLTGGRAVVL